MMKATQEDKNKEISRVIYEEKNEGKISLKTYKETRCNSESHDIIVGMKKESKDTKGECIQESLEQVHENCFFQLRVRVRVRVKTGQGKIII